jgi:hypothetical protein
MSQDVSFCLIVAAQTPQISRNSRLTGTQTHRSGPPVSFAVRAPIDVTCQVVEYGGKPIVAAIVTLSVNSRILPVKAYVRADPNASKLPSKFFADLISSRTAYGRLLLNYRGANIEVIVERVNPSIRSERYRTLNTDTPYYP